MMMMMMMMMMMKKMGTKMGTKTIKIIKVVLAAIDRKERKVMFYLTIQSVIFFKRLCSVGRL